jgi:hypothetical protein
LNKFINNLFEIIILVIFMKEIQREKEEKEKNKTEREVSRANPEHE